MLHKGGVGQHLGDINILIRFVNASPSYEPLAVNFISYYATIHKCFVLVLLYSSST